MGKKRVAFCDEIRKAVDASELSRYRIAKEIGLDHSVMSRFMHGSSWLSERTMNTLAELLELHVAAGKARKKR